MFIGAPLGAYEAHSRRAVLVADASGAWPRMEEDSAQRRCRTACARGAMAIFVAIEMLKVLDVARHITPPASLSFNTVGAYSGNDPRLSLREQPGSPGRDAYTLPGSMRRRPTVGFTAGRPFAGEYRIDVNPAPASRPALAQETHLFRRRAGHLPVRRGARERCAGTPTTPSRRSRRARDHGAAAAWPPAAAGELMTRDSRAATFGVAAPRRPRSRSQTAAVRLTTTRDGDSVTLLHSAHAEYVP